MYKCAQCGKEFWFDGDEYIYKKNVKNGKENSKVLNFCGWNCMRKFEKEKEVKQWMKN